MCIGVPMQVRSVDGRQALCEGRGEQRRVNTALVGAVAPGDWLLVFLGDAREAIGAERAAEVNAVLDLVLGAVPGAAPGADAGLAPPADWRLPQPPHAGFALPSLMSADQLRALTGQ